MVKAYILVQTSVGRAAEVAQAVRALDGVSRCDDVTGPYDAIVTIETEDMESLGHLVQGQVQRIDGITRTVTCPVVPIS